MAFATRKWQLCLTGITGGCHNNNLWCHQWQQSWHFDYSGFSMFYTDLSVSSLIDQSHKSNSAPFPYHSMHHSEKKCAHFYSEWCIVRYGTGALWDLLIWSILYTGLVQKRHNSSAKALELYLFCTNPSTSCLISIFISTLAVPSYHRLP